MKLHILAYTVLLFGSTGAAFAESDRAPFQLITPGVTHLTMPAKFKGIGADPYQYRQPGNAVTAEQQSRLVASQANEGVVQTVNSLPAGFVGGSDGFRRSEMADVSTRHEAAAGARRAAMAVADGRVGGAVRYN